MALKMFFRGPSSRLETLIEKIQQNKDNNSGIDIMRNSLNQMNAIKLFAFIQLRFKSIVFGKPFRHDFFWRD